MGVVRVTWHEFKIWDPLITFENIKLRAPKFVCEYTLCLRMKDSPRNVRGLGQVTLLKNLEPVCIFGTVKYRNFVFDTTWCISYRITPKVGEVSSRDLTLQSSVKVDNKITMIDFTFMLKMPAVCHQKRMTRIGQSGRQRIPVRERKKQSSSSEREKESDRSRS